VAVSRELATFGTIAPNEIDRVTFDYTADIGKTGAITAAAWTCTVSPDSPVADPAAATRVLSLDAVTAHATSALVGTMVDGVIYQLQALATIDDGRVLAKTAGLVCLTEALPDIPPPPADQQVAFSYRLWLARYPEFVSVSELTADQFFAEATLFWRNDGTGPVTDDVIQLRLLNMLVAHLAALNASILLGSPIVGPITSATEGSVSIGGQALVAPGTAAWFVLTRYGAEFWAATAAFRTMRYRVGPRRQFEPPYIWPLVTR
jgi:hypothetical protein